MYKYSFFILILIILWHNIKNKMVISYYSLVIFVIFPWAEFGNLKVNEQPTTVCSERIVQYTVFLVSRYSYE